MSNIIQQVSFTLEELTRMKKCEDEINIILMKHRCSLSIIRVEKNGVLVQNQVVAEAIKEVPIGVVNLNGN